MIYAIDPGPERSNIVELSSDGRPAGNRSEDNADLAVFLGNLPPIIVVAIEDFVPYGQRLGYESMATLKWIGEFRHAAKAVAGCVVVEIPRPDVKVHLCGIKTAKDADVRDALIQRFGPGRERAIGTKKAPGPLYGIKSHDWAALAVAITVWDQQQERN